MRPLAQRVALRQHLNQHISQEPLNLAQRINAVVPSLAEGLRMRSPTETKNLVPSGDKDRATIRVTNEVIAEHLNSPDEALEETPDVYDGGENEVDQETPETDPETDLEPAEDVVSDKDLDNDPDYSSSNASPSEGDDSDYVPSPKTRRVVKKQVVVTRMAGKKVDIAKRMTVMEELLVAKSKAIEESLRTVGNISAAGCQQDPSSQAPPSPDPPSRRPQPLPSQGPPSRRPPLSLGPLSRRPPSLLDPPSRRPQPLPSQGPPSRRPPPSLDPPSRRPSPCRHRVLRRGDRRRHWILHRG
ncbi:hypothetical protein GQ53DRAFT_262716 [Thozetella sp. PMI_491]|nr:hypothetical protein GQ53DRAFT_262716 [Thozetella sp. PMI_491]